MTDLTPPRSLLWTLLSLPGHPLLGGEPIAKRVIICCPTSLVGWVLG